MAPVGQIKAAAKSFSATEYGASPAIPWADKPCAATATFGAACFAAASFAGAAGFAALFGAALAGVFFAGNGAG